MSTIPPLHTLLLSPPFGHHLRPQGVSCVLGSYTLRRRRGLWLRALQTIRPVKGGGWVNRIGLRNAGIDRVRDPGRRRDIISLAALEPDDWHRFADVLDGKRALGHRIRVVELNLSCPNAAVRPITYGEVRRLKQHYHVIAKLSPVEDAVPWAAALVEAGVDSLHLGNTLPPERGGLSGPPLRPITPALIERVRREVSDSIPIIAGGGIQTMADVQRYRDAGADRFSISSLCYYPLRYLAFLRAAREAGLIQPEPAPVGEQSQEGQHLPRP